MRGDMALPKDDALLGIEAGAEEVESDFKRLGTDVAGVGVVGGERVNVRDEEVAAVVTLQAHPVVEGTHVVPQVQATGGAHAAEDAALWVWFRHAELMVADGRVPSPVGGFGWPLKAYEQGDKGGEHGRKKKAHEAAADQKQQEKAIAADAVVRVGPAIRQEVP